MNPSDYEEFEQLERGDETPRNPLEDDYLSPDPIHETKDFAVYVGDMHLGEWKGLQGYQVVNKRTNVIEGEVTVEFGALGTIMELQQNLDRTLGEYKLFQKGPSKEESFEDVLKRLRKPDPEK